MIIKIRMPYPDKILVQFEERDFERRIESTGDLAWCAANEEIMLTFPYPIGKSSRALQAWLINNTLDNMKKLEAIRDKYFMDKNQLKINFPSPN